MIRTKILSRKIKRRNTRKRRWHYFSKSKKWLDRYFIGGAVGHNPISIIIPCHRVVGTDGSLTGYAGGIDKKIFLLKHEKVSLNSIDADKCMR